MDSQQLYDRVERLPAHRRRVGSTEAINEALEAGEYRVAAELFRRFGCREGVVFAVVLGFARQRGENEAEIFEQIYSFLLDEPE